MEEQSLGAYQTVTHNTTKSGCVFSGHEGTIEEAGKYNHMWDWEIQEEHAHKERSSLDLSLPRIFPLGSSDGVKLTKLFLNKDLFQFKYRNRDGGETQYFLKGKNVFLKEDVRTPKTLKCAEHLISITTGCIPSDLEERWFQRDRRG